MKNNIIETIIFTLMLVFMFTIFSIPCYIVWDSFRSNKEINESKYTILTQYYNQFKKSKYTTCSKSSDWIWQYKNYLSNDGKIDNDEFRKLQNQYNGVLVIQKLENEND